MTSLERFLDDWKNHRLWIQKCTVCGCLLTSNFTITEEGVLCPKCMEGKGVNV